MNNLWYIEDSNNLKMHEDDIINKLLLNRGIDTKNKVETFLQPDYQNLKDPYELKDMKKAVNRIIKAISNNEKILIYGDYDVDGITSTSLLIHFFKNINFTNFEYYIPNRLKESYGLNKESLENIEINKVNLIITVDCGITAVNEIEYLNQKEIDVIITDHHKLGNKLPNAYAILDPQREKDDYYKVLAGVGVVFKFLQAVDEKLELNCIQNHLDLVALGTVADIVPLINDNRILVKHGLAKIKNTDKLGLEKLLNKLKLDKEDINPGRIGYIIAPPINAIGRMENPAKGVQLLTTKSEKEADEISKNLIKINKDRQNKEEEIYEDALNMINTKDIKSQNPLILASEDWHRGVIGIVASRLVEKYYLPVILIAIDEDGEGHGSARSISGLDITEGLEFSKEWLESYGGHSMAAGLTIKKDNLDKFQKKFKTFLNNELTPEDFIPGLKIDSIIDVDDINLNFYKKLELLKPFGLGNPRPKFLLSNINLKKYYTVGNDNKHLKIELSNGISGICFNMGEMNTRINNEMLDLAVKIDLNNWRGRNEVEIRVEDINIRSDHSYFPITFFKDDFTLYDKRKINNKMKYIKGLKKYQTDIAVYINGEKKIKQLKKDLSNKNLDVIVNDFKKFEKIDDSILLFNKSGDNNINKNPHLVLYSVPFSLKELFKFINSFGKVKQPTHLIFNKEDLILNEKLIRQKLPNKTNIKQIYSYFKRLEHNSIDNKKEIYDDIINNLDLNKNLLNKIMKILKELKLVKESKDELKIINRSFTELDLSKSVYYNNIIKVMKEYQYFKKVLKDDNLFKLINNLMKLEEENNEF
ncbi:MAG: single-stranded-DNA-specific exonuclease RecJ [Halanaerobiales bacterium]|nr:single-stranded-DNA-specific exonuclease RecJ [Halanaerobiales bacterium]